VHDLKGVPGRWQLFAVASHDGQAPSAAGTELTESSKGLGLSDRAGLRLARWAPGIARAGIRAMRRRSHV
jgi:hypothetical protein